MRSCSEVTHKQATSKSQIATLVRAGQTESTSSGLREEESLTTRSQGRTTTALRLVGQQEEAPRISLLRATIAARGPLPTLEPQPGAASLWLIALMLM